MMVFALAYRDDPIGSISLHVKTKDKWHIFEDGFLIRYIQAAELALGAMICSGVKK